MSQETSRRSVTVTILLLVAAAALWASVMAVLVFAVPRYERDFRDQGLRLPNATIWAVRCNPSSTSNLFLQSGTS